MIVWVTVHTEVSPWDAQIVAGRLRAEGVSAIVLFDQWITLAWPKSLAYGLVPIQVPAEQIQAAREVLEIWRQGAWETALAHELQLDYDVDCPCCGAYRWLPLRAVGSQLLAVCMALLWGAAFVPELVGRRCGACGMRQPWSAFGMNDLPSGEIHGGATSRP